MTNPSKPRLLKSMSLAQFDNGYWYATELKRFAKTLGIPATSKLRKDEIEAAIKHFLKTGKAKLPTKRKLEREGVRDVERGLSLRLRVVLYTNDTETKEFLEREVRRLVPGMKMKSGARYRLNRWREEQLTRGKRITYGDLIKEYVRLNQVKGPFMQAPSGRYINFSSDFFAGEKDATREKALAAWAQLKNLDVPKDYKSWAKWRRARK